MTNVNPKLTNWLGKMGSWTIAASIDGIDQRNRYIRYPADWNNIVKNLEFYKNIIKLRGNGSIAFGPAIQLLNIDQLVDLCEFFQNTYKESGIGFYSHVKYPIICDYDILPLPYKKEVADDLEKNLHKMFEQKTKMVVIDMRNSYEHEVGHFEGSLDPGTDKFYELPQKISTLSKYKSHKVITVCTGGIRCEKASALLKEEGFEDVSQLEGGIVKYLEKYPNGYFKGKNFVFDERMVTNGDTQSGKSILSKCAHCQKPCDRYLDCKIAECNKLYICCANCEKSHSGQCPAETMKVTIQ